MEDIDFESDGFIKENDFKLINYKDHECVIEAPITEKVPNPYKVSHGGFVFGLMDTCGGVHIMIETKRKAVTISSSINFIKPGLGKKLIAKSKEIKIGKNISVVEVNAYNDNDDLIATGVFNYYYIN